MSSDIERELSRKLAVALSKEIDIDKLAKKIAPQMEKIIEAKMKVAMKKLRVDDFIYDSLGMKASTAVQDMFIRAINKMK